MGFLTFSQERSEREHRIRKVQFPTIDMALLTSAANGSKLKRIRYYEAVDSTETINIFKFKMQRLHYEVYYESSGTLKKIGFKVNEIDFPSEAYDAITTELGRRFEKHKIRRMFQEYTVDDNPQKTVKDAFQNLLLPTNSYRLIVLGTVNGNRQEYEAIFGAKGALIEIQDALPPNYDHVLY